MGTERAQKKKKSRKVKMAGNTEEGCQKREGGEREMERESRSLMYEKSTCALAKMLVQYTHIH